MLATSQHDQKDIYKCVQVFENPKTWQLFINSKTLNLSKRVVNKGINLSEVPNPNYQNEVNGAWQNESHAETRWLCKFAKKKKKLF